MMYDSIKDFQKQLEYKPKIENSGNLKLEKKFVLVGMGGSHLAADILKIYLPGVDLVVHENYVLPQMEEKDLRDRLVILNSYSGNTEETISAFEEAGKRKLNRAVISTGGKLIDLAKKGKVAYIQMPDTGIQPRSALGFNLLALLKIIGKDNNVDEINRLALSFKPDSYENQGRVLAEKLKGKIPIIYSSERNYGLAYNWKIIFNETAKIPSFCNMFPELNHNEMEGLEREGVVKNLSQNFHFIFIRDSEDDPKITKRMDVTKKLLNERELLVEVLDLEGKTRIERIFASRVLAEWAGYYLAEKYGVDPDRIAMVEKFKELIR